MSIQYMWGPNGEYGPFSAGDDGYPRAGEVVRHYRILKEYSATKFAQLYGKALGEKPKTRIWVLTMERTNNVPTDITRRRAISDLLAIPPILLGLGETLAKTPLTADIPELEYVGERVPKRETLIAEVLNEYEQVLTTYFNGYTHRHGQAVLTEVTGAADQINLWLPRARERTIQRGTTIISQHYRFSTNIAREQQRYDLAITNADKTIENAEAAHKIKPDTDLMAIAFYARSITSFEQENTRINQPSNYHAAVPYIDAAYEHARSATPLMNGLISLEWGLIHAYTVTSEDEKILVQKRLADGYAYIPEGQPGDDPNFIFAKYAPGYYHMRYAEALIALGEYTEALGKLDVAEELTPLNLPRRFAYIDALRSTAHAGLGELEEAVDRAKDALIGSTSVKSEYNIARIAKVYRQLREEYKHSSDVTELGRELAKTHPHLV